MTQNDIIQMARKAGMSGLSLIDIGYLERFHALAIAAAKEEMLMAGNDQRLEEARAAEREACADICKGYANGNHNNLADLCEMDIRARK